MKVGLILVIFCLFWLTKGPGEEETPAPTDNYQLNLYNKFKSKNVYGFTILVKDKWTQGYIRMINTFPFCRTDEVPSEDKKKDDKKEGEDEEKEGEDEGKEGGDKKEGDDKKEGENEEKEGDIKEADFAKFPNILFVIDLDRIGKDYVDNRKNLFISIQEHLPNNTPFKQPWIVDFSQGDSMMDKLKESHLWKKVADSLHLPEDPGANIAIGSLSGIEKFTSKYANTENIDNALISPDKIAQFVIELRYTEKDPPPAGLLEPATEKDEDEDDDKDKGDDEGEDKDKEDGEKDEDKDKEDGEKDKDEDKEDGEKDKDEDKGDDDEDEGEDKGDKDKDEDKDKKKKKDPEIPGNSLRWLGMTVQNCDVDRDYPGDIQTTIVTRANCMYQEMGAKEKLVDVQITSKGKFLMNYFPLDDCKFIWECNISECKFAVYSQQLATNAYFRCRLANVPLQAKFQAMPYATVESYTESGNVESEYYGKLLSLSFRFFTDKVIQLCPARDPACAPCPIDARGCYPYCKCMLDLYKFNAAIRRCIGKPEMVIALQAVATYETEWDAKTRMAPMLTDVGQIIAKKPINFLTKIVMTISLMAKMAAVGMTGAGGSIKKDPLARESAIRKIAMWNTEPGRQIMLGPLQKALCYKKINRGINPVMRQRAMQQLYLLPSDANKMKEVQICLEGGSDDSLFELSNFLYYWDAKGIPPPKTKFKEISGLIQDVMKLVLGLITACPILQWLGEFFGTKGFPCKMLLNLMETLFAKGSPLGWVMKLINAAQLAAKLYLFQPILMMSIISTVADPFSILFLGMEARIDIRDAYPAVGNFIVIYCLQIMLMTVYSLLWAIFIGDPVITPFDFCKPAKLLIWICDSCEASPPAVMEVDGEGPPIIMCVVLIFKLLILIMEPILDFFSLYGIFGISEAAWEKNAFDAMMLKVAEFFEMIAAVIFGIMAMIGKGIGDLLLPASEGINALRDKINLKPRGVDYGKQPEVPKTPSVDELMWTPIAILADKFGQKDDGSDKFGKK